MNYEKGVCKTVLLSVDSGVEKRRVSNERGEGKRSVDGNKGLGTEQEKRKSPLTTDFNLVTETEREGM